MTPGSRLPGVLPLHTGAGAGAGAGLQDWQVVLAGSSSLASQRLRQLLEPLLELQGKLLVTLFTDGLHVKLNKLVSAKKKKGRERSCKYSKYVK